MKSFIDELGKSTSVTTTENGDKAYTTTGHYVLDFFSRAGAMRSDVQGAVNLFAKAYAEDSLLALKALFYLRDVRGGQGERALFRACIQWLEDEDPKVAVKLVSLYGEYGRWDDLLSIRNETVLTEMFNVINRQLIADEAAMAAGEPVSLLAKWLPSENASSEMGRTQARAIATALDLKPVQYRTRISALRKYIKLLEHKMSANQWPEIEYGKIPAQAGRKHTKAFRRHDEDRYEQYLADVMSGKETMNASTLFTYEIYNMVNQYSGDATAADAMWKSLPDFTQGKNALVIADVSGSMTGMPMAVSVSLALYFAERNKGAFKGYFMTFSAAPKLQRVVGATLSSKMRSIERSDWGMNTDLGAAFNAVLKAAVAAKAKADEIPSTLYIISDMQFDGCVHANKSTFEKAKAAFEAAGYELPHIVFWNVNAREQSPVTKFEGNVSLISGSSQSAFALAVEGKSPMETMVDALNSERYAPVEKALA